MKVWIVNSSGHDFEGARKFGDELIPLTYGRVNIFNVERLFEEFKGKMSSFEEEDWLLLSGNTILNVIATLIIYEKFSNTNILIFDVIKKEYVPREITTKQVKQ